MLSMTEQGHMRLVRHISRWKLHAVRWLGYEYYARTGLRLYRVGLCYSQVVSSHHLPKPPQKSISYRDCTDRRTRARDTGSPRFNPSYCAVLVQDVSHLYQFSRCSNDVSHSLLQRDVPAVIFSGVDCTATRITWQPIRERIVAAVVCE